MKKNVLSLLSLLSLLLLSGCIKYVKKDQNSKDKKVALLGNGVPLARFDGDPRFCDDKVEGYILEDDSTIAEQTSSDNSSSKRKMSYKVSDEKTFDFEPIMFSYDNYSIRKDQEPTVAYNVANAKNAQKKGKIIRVEGHSDKRCISETYNIAISQKRADQVATRLAQSGIKKENIKIVGYGDSKPAVNVLGKEARNRRVECVALTA